MFLRDDRTRSFVEVYPEQEGGALVEPVPGSLDVLTEPVLLGEIEAENRASAASTTSTSVRRYRLSSRRSGKRAITASRSADSAAARRASSGSIRALKVQ